LALGRTCDAVVCLGRIAPDALLGAADGVCEQRIDARVLTELGREAGPAGGAGLLALAQPALEAGQAEVVLAWTLQETAETGTDAQQGFEHGTGVLVAVVAAAAVATSRWRSAQHHWCDVSTVLTRCALVLWHRACFASRCRCCCARLLLPWI
jgi:hypothetical protein